MVEKRKAKIRRVRKTGGKEREAETDRMPETVPTMFKHRKEKKLWGERRERERQD